MNSLLQGMFQPQYIAEWQCSIGDSTYRFGTEITNVTGTDLFVSILTVSTTSGMCSYSLTVRYA